MAAAPTPALTAGTNGAQKRHLIPDSSIRKYKRLVNVAFPKNPEKARKRPLRYWFDAFLGTRQRIRTYSYDGRLMAASAPKPVAGQYSLARRQPEVSQVLRTLNATRIARSMLS